MASCKTVQTGYFENIFFSDSQWLICYHLQAFNFAEKMSESYLILLPFNSNLVVVILPGCFGDLFLNYPGN